jgi:bifunctional non-homologous end joining protein LigD
MRCDCSRAKATTGPSAILRLPPRPPNCWRSAVFDALHRHGKVREAILQAFDLLELNGQDFRPLSLGERKKRLARLLARVTPGITLNEHTDASGELVFRQACAMGLEGIVSKRLAAPYRSGPSRDWIKIKNPDSPAMVRHREGRW